MFGRNKICWYSCCLTPSFPPSCPSQPIPRQHQPSFLFISAKFPPHQAHPRNPHTSFIPLVPSSSPHGIPPLSAFLFPLLAWTTLNPLLANQPPYLLRSATAVMAAVTESIKVVLMRLNCRRYCRPPPPLSPRIPHLPSLLRNLPGATVLPIHPQPSTPFLPRTSLFLDSPRDLPRLPSSFRAPCTQRRATSSHHSGFRRPPTLSLTLQRLWIAPTPTSLLLVVSILSETTPKTIYTPTIRSLYRVFR